MAKVDGRLRGGFVAFGSALRKLCGQRFAAVHKCREHWSTLDSQNQLELQ